MLVGKLTNLLVAHTVVLIWGCAGSQTTLKVALSNVGPWLLAHIGALKRKGRQRLLVPRARRLDESLRSHEKRCACAHGAVKGYSEC